MAQSQTKTRPLLNGGKARKMYATSAMELQEGTSLSMALGHGSSMAPPVIPGHVRRQKLKYLQFREAARSPENQTI